MSNYEFICDFTGAIFTIVAPAGLKDRNSFLYCPTCGRCSVLPWKGFQNRDGLTPSKTWAENHRWEEV